MAADRRRGAHRWAMVLSELAETPVDVSYQRPCWQASWADGPTEAMLQRRALALDEYRIGGPLPAAQLSFRRLSTPRAWALAWLDHGITPAADPFDVIGRVERLLDTQPYPARRPAEALACADLLARLAAGSEYRMGTLLAEANPPPAHPPAGQPPDTLPGRVTGLSWPRRGPTAELLGRTTPAPEPNTAGNTGPDHDTSEQAVPYRPDNCQTCGNPLHIQLTGRPAHYCSATCRSRARRWRKKHRLGANVIDDPAPNAADAQ